MLQNLFYPVYPHTLIIRRTSVIPIVAAIMTTVVKTSTAKANSMTMFNTVSKVGPTAMTATTAAITINRYNKILQQ